MPAKPVSVNLLGQEDVEHTPQGRIVNWALTYGRYIMIGTEIVVLLAFISRFSLDRKRTDLKEEIDQKQAIIEANRDFENEIRKTQDRIELIQSLLTTQTKPFDMFKKITSLLPPDVTFGEVDISPDKLSARATAGTNQGFAQLLTNLQSTKEIVRVEVNDVTKNALSGIDFKFTAYFTLPKGNK